MPQYQRVSSAAPLSVDVESYPPTRYAWYAVGVLTVAYIFSFIDRQILNLLVGPIRRDLGISDTQMSLLMGFSFAIFYTLFGIPLGRLADSRSRRTIIIFGIVFWSLMTAGCGLARSFWHFLVLRMGVGVGEATLSPSAYSLISDYFPKENRATAISVYSMGIYLGQGIAFLLGGLVIRFASAHESYDVPLVGATRPWQLIFFILGFSGVLFSLLMYTVKEPVRKGVQLVKAADGGLKVAQVSVGTLIAYIRENLTTFLCHNLGFALFTFSAIGSFAWIPTFFIRKHGWTGSQAGVVFGAIVGLAGTLGVVAGGRLADRLARHGYGDSNMRVGLIGVIAVIPAGVLYPLMPSANLAATLLLLMVFFTSMPFGVAAAAIQEIMPNNMRGQASAIYLFVINLIGLGLGPTAVAVMTDYVFRDDNAVNYSLLVVGTMANLASATLLWAGLKPYLRTLNSLKGWAIANAESEGGRPHQRMNSSISGKERSS